MYSEVTYPTPTTAVLTITGAGPLNVLSTPVIHALTKQLGELAENQGLHCLSTRITVDTSGFARPVGTPAEVTATVTWLGFTSARPP